MASIENVNRVGRCLAGAALVAFQQRDAIADERVLRQMTAELAGLGHALAGMLLTDADERAGAHVQRIRGLVAQLPQVDHGSAD